MMLGDVIEPRLACRAVMKWRRNVGRAGTLRFRPDDAWQYGRTPTGVGRGIATLAAPSGLSVFYRSLPFFLGGRTVLNVAEALIKSISSNAP